VQQAGEGGGRVIRLALATASLCGLSACAMSLPMGSLVDEDEITTSSVTPRPRKAPQLSPDLGEEDWRRAKNAMGVALDPQGSGSQVSWDNPDSRMKGAFKPLGQPFVKNDEICRSFAATLSGGEKNASVEGTACRPSGGEWVLKEVKPRKG
jgi:hypothetical protein